MVTSTLILELSAELAPGQVRVGGGVGCRGWSSRDCRWVGSRVDGCQGESLRPGGMGDALDRSSVGSVRSGRGFRGGLVPGCRRVQRGLTRAGEFPLRPVGGRGSRDFALGCAVRSDGATGRRGRGVFDSAQTGEAVVRCSRGGGSRVSGCRTESTRGLSCRRNFDYR